MARAPRRGAARGPRRPWERMHQQCHPPSVKLACWQCCLLKSGLAGLALGLTHAFCGGRQMGAFWGRFMRAGLVRPGVGGVAKRQHIAGHRHDRRPFQPGAAEAGYKREIQGRSRRLGGPSLQPTAGGAVAAAGPLRGGLVSGRALCRGRRPPAVDAAYCGHSCGGGWQRRRRRRGLGRAQGGPHGLLRVRQPRRGRAQGAPRHPWAGRLAVRRSGRGQGRQGRGVGGGYGAFILARSLAGREAAPAHCGCAAGVATPRWHPDGVTGGRCHWGTVSLGDSRARLALARAALEDEHRCSDVRHGVGRWAAPRSAALL
jgi:hypothetical protein